MTKRKSTKSALISSVLALCLCFTMLLGTTFAWFTDSVTSSGNIIQTGELKVGFEWAEGTTDPTNTAWNDASEGAIFDYANWEPGYAMARHLKVSNEGTLALNYKMRIVANGVVSNLADVIDVYYFAEDKALVRDDIADATYLGTLTEVLGTEKNLSKTVYGAIKAGDPADIHTIILKMNENADNEYQNMDLGCTFSVELLATQMASENDSFDNKYDNATVIPDSAVPTALVTYLDDLDVNYTLGIGGASYSMTLDAGYQFEPTISEEDVLSSEYKHWHPDFYVYADRDVPSNSIALAGYYNAWCQYNNDNWVALVNDGMPVEGGSENGVRLVSSLACVTYKDICKYGNDGMGFRCGIAGIDKEALAGTTITVEYRLYETEGEWSDSSHTCQEVTPENYMVLGTFTYTFPAINASSQDELNNAISSNDDVVISLGAGDYTLPNTNGKTVEIIGTEDTVIDVTGGYYAETANLTFKGVTFDCILDSGNGGDYELIYSSNATFIDCTFNGAHGVGRDGAKYIGCTFNLPADYVWSFANDTVFDGCTFNSQGKALLLYNHGGSEMVNVTVTNCVFKATAPAYAYAISNLACAAIEIDNYGCSINLIASNNTVDSDFSGEWRIKSFYDNGNTVTVNGTAYTQTALDGTLLTVVDRVVQ